MIGINTENISGCAYNSPVVDTLERDCEPIIAPIGLEVTNSFECASTYCPIRSASGLGC